MKTKTGIVMELNKSSACLLTNTGEFVKVRINTPSPSIGTIYSGKVINSFFLPKKALIAASLTIFILLNSMIYAYSKPTTSVLVDMDASFSLKLNHWNKIIKISPLNQAGEELLSSVAIKNKELSEGLNLLFIKSYDENNDYLMDDNCEIIIYISDNKTINISNFETSIKERNMSLSVNYENSEKMNNEIKHQMMNKERNQYNQDNPQNDSYDNRIPPSNKSNKNNKGTKKRKGLE